MRSIANSAFLRLRASWPTLLIIVDGGVTALANVLSLTIAAKLLDSAHFSQFALIQLVVVTGVMVQRAFVLAPGLAAQKEHGRGTFSPNLIMRLSLPCGLVVGGGVLLGSRGDPTQLFLVLASSIATWGALSMDVVRYCLLTSGRRLLMLSVNALWGGLLVVGLLILPPSSAGYLAAWGMAALLIAGITSAQYLRAVPGVRQMRLKQIWSLGRWSGLDASMSAAANLLPMLAASAIADGGLVGTYRLLQSTLGPLNIISASLVTIYSVDAWKLSDPPELNALNRRVRRYSLVMFAGTALYVSGAEAFVMSLTDRWTTDNLRICVIVAIAGITGALTASYSAGALALGAQKSGALLRVFIVTWSMCITLLPRIGVTLPWNDPIAPVTLFAAIFGLIAWTVAYRRALHKSRLLAGVTQDVT